MKESLKLQGKISIKHYNEDGKLLNEFSKQNVVVTVGKNYLAGWMAAASQAGYFMQYIGLGTGTAAALASDTNLETPLPSRIAGNITSSSNTWRNQATFGAGVNSGAITESGLFSESSGGTMMARQVFPVINKQAGDTIVFTWEISFS
jgi:hypothetical protein